MTAGRSRDNIFVFKFFFIHGKGGVGMVWACYVLDDVTLVAA